MTAPFDEISDVPAVIPGMKWAAIPLTAGFYYCEIAGEHVDDDPDRKPEMAAYVSLVFGGKPGAWHVHAALRICEKCFDHMRNIMREAEKRHGKKSSGVE